RTAQVAMPAKNMPGRKAGEDHARSQGCLRQEAFLKPVCWRRPVKRRESSPPGRLRLRQYHFVVPGSASS
ncbi:MAG: hypothetical protein PHD38_06585, partial [Mesotoga sp.]|nr:hypothetical protein [Mesotoga sp.]